MAIDNKKLYIIKNLVKKSQIKDATKMIISLLETDPFDTKLWFELAKIKLLQAKYLEAKDLFLEILRYNPLDTYAMFELAKVYSYLGENEEAENILNGIISISFDKNFKPNDRFAKLELGKVLVKQERYFEAKQVFKDLLHTKSHVYAKLELGKIYVLENRLHKAEKTFLEILYNFPNDNYAKLELSKVYMQMGKFESAKKHLDEILKSNPNDRYAYIEKSKLYALLGNKSKSKEILKETSEKFPNDLYVKLRLAKSYIDNEEFNEASDILLRLLCEKFESKEKEKEFILNVKGELGFLYYKLGKYPLARKFLNEKFCFLQDEITELRLAKIYIKEGQIDTAISKLEEMVKKYNDANSKYGLGKAYIKKGEILKALELFKSLLKTDRANYARSEIAKIYMNMGLLNNSLSIYKKVSKTSNLELGSLEIVKNYMEMGNLDKAKIELDNHLSKYPSDRYAMLELGRYLIKIGEKEEGVEILNNLLFTKGEDAVIAELMFVDIENKDYNSALYKLNKIYDRLEKADQIKNFLNYKLNLPYSKDDYYSKQMSNYSYNLFDLKMSSKTYNYYATAADTQFLDQNMITSLYSRLSKDIKEFNPVSRSIYNKYIIDVGEVIGTTNGIETSKIMVVTFIDSYNILLFYPVSMEYGVSTKNKKMILN